MSDTRAKVRLSKVSVHTDENGATVAERWEFNAVSKSEAYPNDGTDEDNTYALWTPTADFDMYVNNPNLFGKFQVGDTFYVDFTKINKVD